jgi:DNA-binding transcriptional MerR regulator
VAERSDSPPWTIEELQDAVLGALSVGYEGQVNGQIRDVPDLRAIRYYTTLGLIDRPASMRGRTALYGRKHLLQLVAIKRLQARGLSLQEVQRQLAGTPMESLRRIARLPREVREFPESTFKENVRRGRAFWTEFPAESDQEDLDEVEPPQTRAAPLLTGIPIGDQLTLLIAPNRTLGREDLRALERAARPLLRQLIARGLIEPTAQQRGES